MIFKAGQQQAIKAHFLAATETPNPPRRHTLAVVANINHQLVDMSAVGGIAINADVIRPVQHAVRFYGHQFLFPKAGFFPHFRAKQFSLFIQIIRKVFRGFFGNFPAELPFPHIAHALVDGRRLIVAHRGHVFPHRRIADADATTDVLVPQLLHRQRMKREPVRSLCNRDNCLSKHSCIPRFCALNPPSSVFAAHARFSCLRRITAPLPLHTPPRSTPESPRPAW